MDYGGYLSLTAGPAYVFGDTFGPVYEKSILNGNNWITSIVFRQLTEGNIGYSINLGYSNYVGSDTNTHHHQDGFYAYSSDIIEFSVRGEYTLRLGPRFQMHPPHSVYAFLGIGAISTNVKTTVSTAAPVTQNVMGPVVPFGAGYRFDINSQFSIGVEACAKVGFTDDIDGYHPKGTANDNLANFSLTVAYKIF